MKQCIEYINNKRVYNFNYDKLIKLNNWCAKTYFNACAQLYNLGRLSLPSEFDTTDFITTLSDEEYKILTNSTTGKLDLDYETVDSLLIINAFEDKLSFQYLSQILYAIEVNKILCDMCSSGIERNKTGVVKATINIKYFDNLRINQGIDYFNLDILNCLKYEDDKFFSANFDLRGIYLTKLAEFIGIDNNIYKTEYVDKNKSLLYKNFTFDTDKNLVRLYLNGHLFGDNFNAEKFKKLYLDFYKGLVSDSTKNKPSSFSEMVYKECELDVDNYITKLRTTLKARDIYIEDRAITREYWSCWVSNDTEGDYNKYYKINNDFCIGLYFYNHTTGIYDDNISLRLQGFSGEYVYYKDRRKYKLKGLPVIINDELYYPIYNADKEYVKCEHLFKRNEVKHDTFVLDSKAVEIHNLLTNIDTDNYSVEYLQDEFNRINLWLKNISSVEKEDMFTKIIGVYS